MKNIALLLVLLLSSPSFAGNCTTLSNGLAVVIAGLRGNVQELMTALVQRTQDPVVKDRILQVGARLHDRGLLRKWITLLGNRAHQRGLFPAAITKENLASYLDQLASGLEAELMARGLTKDSQGNHYESWHAMGGRVRGEVASALAPLLKRAQAAGKSVYELPEFQKLFEDQTGVKLHTGDSFKLLINGPASFAKRAELIDKAKSKIYIMSWAFYDDDTGEIFSKKLIQKAETSFLAGNPVDIKIIVDGQTAERPTYQKRLAEMEAAGIQILRWRSNDPKRPYDGQHRKVMVVDDEVSIEGGLNFGDEYSHLGPDSTPKWRDTDVMVTGPGAREAGHLFAKEWNEHLSEQRTRAEENPPTFVATNDPQKSALVNHRPGEDENIRRATYLAILGAKSSIDISNAYLILDPILFRAIVEARKRGVRVRVHTNSLESIDVPELSGIIMKSVNHLVKSGVKVYVKKGSTLHSKYMVVDGVYSWVGSENLHPRSQRYEGEVVRAVIGTQFGGEVEAMFEADIQTATRVKGPIAIPPSHSSDLLSYWLYDQL